MTGESLFTVKGILLVSHGNLAEGMLNTLSYFFSEQMRHVGSLALAMGDAPESFKEKLQKKIEDLDSGDGVLVFTDLYGGTPSNTAASLLMTVGESEALTVITGFNLPMVMEAMTMNENGPIDVQEILEIGRSGIMCINEVLTNRKKK